MRTIEVKLYTFDELSEAAKEKALKSLAYVNVDHEWWETTYEDAKQIGLNITGFGLERDKHATGALEYSLNESVDLILKNHGEDCKTVAIAKRYAAAWSDLVEKYSDGVKLDQVTEENEYDFDQEADELETEFLKDLLSEYADMLEDEYEYHTSEDAIKETIEANEYEFTEDGTMQ